MDHDQGRRCDQSRTGCRTGHQVTNQRQLRANVQFCPGKLHLGPKRSLSGFGQVVCFSFATRSRPNPIRPPPESREPPSTAQQRGSPRLPTRRAGGCVGRSAVPCRARSGTWRCATGARLDLSSAGFAPPATHKHARTAPPPRWRNRRPIKHAIRPSQ